MRIKLKQGLDIPVQGGVNQSISDSIEYSPTRQAALIASTFHGLKPQLMVEVGDEVRVGQALIQDKRNPSVLYTAPVSGVIRSINRGYRRALLSIVIESQNVQAPTHDKFSEQEIASCSVEKIRTALLKTGLWVSLRTRPYSKVPDPTTTPHAIFITAMDTRPLSPNANLIIQQAQEEFRFGVHALSRLTPGKTLVCSAPDSHLALPSTETVHLAEFEGPHPAGLVGTHIHYLEPVHENKTVWSINYQDVIAIGRLFKSGELSFERVIALAGPSVSKPRFIRTHIGACVSELCAKHMTSQAEHSSVRFIAGSVLDGWKAEGALDFLGHDTLQITALPEHAKSKLFGWLVPLAKSFSLSRSVSWFSLNKNYDFNCRKNGSERAFVPLGLYEHVLGLDLLPAPLLRALLTMDIEMAKKLGCLELDEEDLALCSYVCPSKHEFGLVLRSVLERIEKEA